MKGLAIAAVTALFVQAAQALDYSVQIEPGGSVLVATGKIEAGEDDRLARAILSTGIVSEVHFHSPGGSLEAGIAMGELLRARGLAARVPAGASCASACVYAFVGAVVRSVDPGARVGVHMFSASRNPALVDSVRSAIRAHGAEGAREVIMTLERRAALTAARQARFLVEMSVSLALMTPTFETAHDDIHWLSDYDLRRYNVVSLR